MKQWVCNVCEFVYDEAEGMPTHGIPQGTAFADLPHDWFCPECGARANAFYVLGEENLEEDGDVSDLINFVLNR